MNIAQRETVDAYPNTMPARLATGAVPAIARATGAPTDRWIVAVAGVVLQLCLGTVYAWGLFQSKIVLAFGWSIAIFTLGLALRRRVR